MKELFENAELEVIELNSEEVIVVSCTEDTSAGCGTNSSSCVMD